MIDVFLSVGATANETQEQFVRAVEDRLRSEGILTHTVGRNLFSTDAPLKTIQSLMARCAGTLVLALERTYYSAGVELRDGPKERRMEQVRLPTPWNHIEAAIAYTMGHPLFVVVEDGLKNEGLLEPGHDWYVCRIRVDSGWLGSAEFAGRLSDWKAKMLLRLQS